ncbi:hypothetical protein D3C73_1290880 [compost metagenome]
MAGGHTLFSLFYYHYFHLGGIRISNHYFYCRSDEHSRRAVRSGKHRRGDVDATIFQDYAAIARTDDFVLAYYDADVILQGIRSDLLLDGRRP